MAAHHQRLLGRHVGQKRRPRRLQLAAGSAACASRSVPSGEAFVEERLQLREVLGHQAGRRRRGRRPPGVARALRLAADLRQHPFEIGLDEGPGAHVLRLFLAPHDLGLLEARQLLDQRLQRERIELLDPQQIDVVDAALLALLVEVVIDLARAQDDAADLVVLGELDLLALVRLRMIPQQAMEASCRGRRPRAATPRACCAASTSASSRSAACGTRA